MGGLMKMFRFGKMAGVVRVGRTPVACEPVVGSPGWESTCADTRFVVPAIFVKRRLSHCHE
ncbi:MAG TPA: hypothetical protein DEB39_02975 [Planctomycetaceae bacterium]|nr:hypothetical protein [Planctomycetaceae bacterium]